MSVSDLESHLGFWLRFVSNHVSQQFARQIETRGVSVAEWVVLREMYDVDRIAPSVIASRTGLSRGAISKLVDRLLERQLVTRTEATGDRRFQDVGLTSAGRELVPQLASIADRNDEEFFSHLPAAERQRLMATLKRLVAANGLTIIPTE
jgi:DNA-binding MarR family transcriptional regulator